MSTGAAAAETQPGDGVFLRYLGRHGAAADRITRPPQLSVSLGGRRVAAVMDTGSTGLVVSASVIPELGRLPSDGPGRLVYSSSGRVMTGIWVRTAVTIQGSNGASVRSPPLPVLAVTRVECLRAARDCRPEERPRGIAMLGIGFGREADGQQRSTPDKNPFLAGPAEPGGRRGYVVSRDGVTVGLTDEAVRGMSFVKLERMPGGADWAGAPMCVSVQPDAPPSCGKVLVDTGVSKMFLTVPPDRAGTTVVRSGPGGATLRPGTEVRVVLAAEENAAAPGYGFVVGQPDVMAPAAIDVVPRPGEAAFVNTGVHFLNGFDIAYDAANGAFGYRSNALPCSRC